MATWWLASGDLGNPTSTSPFAVYYNPTLGGAESTQLTLDVLAGVRHATYERNQDAASASSKANAQDPNYLASNFGTANLTNATALPFFGISSDLGGSKLIHVGFASYIPFGGMARWDKNDALTGPGKDGVQRWANIEGSLISYYNTVAVAVTIPKTNLSFGINGSLVYSFVNTVRARNSNGSDDYTSNGSLSEGRAWIDAKGLQAAAAIGMYWAPEGSGKVKVGLSYTMRPNFGQMRLKGVLHQQFGGVAERTQTTDVDFLQTFPDVFRLGASTEVNRRLEMRGDIEYVTWSVFKRQCIVSPGGKCQLYDDGSQLAGGDVKQVIPRNWSDTLGVRVGASFFPYAKHDTQIFGSVGFKTPPVGREYIDPSGLDSTRFTFALGGEKWITPHLGIGGSANFEYFAPVTTDERQKYSTLAAPSKSPSANGRYTQIIAFANVNATYKF
ncbi:MAG: hypothetical protein U0165_20765 [Polyangiaceae bacterium]